ncbi:MAG: FHA domain-containing protein [Lachnospiraceae bacterium]|nr:FHA domain-containing protein [Lachnospiraceae bacterium]
MNKLLDSNLFNPKFVTLRNGGKMKMLDVKYYKDYRHNYLIIKDNSGSTENVYQRKMVTENKIQGLLVSQERYINGEILLYYEITSRQSLFSIYDGRNIGMKELCSFFVQLKIVNDTLQKYLLDVSCLLLMPEYVFQNIETGEYSFLYYPDAEENSFLQLMDFFISKVDNEDLKAVEIVYKIADLVHREQFVLDEVLKWFQDDIVGEEEKNIEESQYQKSECDSCFQQEEKAIPLKPLSDGAKKNEMKRTLKQTVCALGIGIAGAGALIYIMCSYQLTYQEEIYLIVGWIMVAALLLGSAAWYLYLLLTQRKHGEEQESIKEVNRYVSTYENDMPISDSDLGNTVYIPWTENYENKLYSLDRKVKCHIDLGSLPLIVGKLAGAVDMVIDEHSISRMHAKFFREGNKIYVTDLNSTNGTFRNGMRLAPNASEIIEPGDEIRLGKLKFIYR